MPSVNFSVCTKVDTLSIVNTQTEQIFDWSKVLVDTYIMLLFLIAIPINKENFYDFYIESIRSKSKDSLAKRLLEAIETLSI